MNCRCRPGLSKEGEGLIYIDGRLFEAGSELAAGRALGK